MAHRTFLRIVAGALLASSCLLASAQALLDDIRKNKVVRVGVPVDLAPFGSIGPDNQPQGLDIDMARLIASKLGVNVQLVPVASPQRIPMLQDHKVDLVISTLGKNPEREKQVDFTKSYSSFYLAVFGAKDLHVTSSADIKGHKVAVTRGSIEDQELTKVAPQGAMIERFDDAASAIKAYVDGKVPLLAIGIGAATAAASKSPKIQVDMKFIVKESENFIGVPKGEDKLRKEVDAIIDDAQSTGELRKLRSKWFSRSGMSS